MPSELMLEEFLERDPTLLGERLLVIGRQVRTPYQKFIDLLAMDIEGNLHVLELKRDKTPRDVVAQVLDYGSWVTTLDRETIIDLANEHLGTPFETAFEDTFGISAPDELNASLSLVVVATDLDSSSERIVTYLRDFGVPVNVVFFTYLEDDDRRYLARSWLAPDDETSGATGTAARRAKSKRAEWNGIDWFASFGDEGRRSWEDGRRYGFISAGAGAWYSNSLRNLPVGGRVNVHIPKNGYVAVGTVLGTAQRIDEAHVEIDGQWVRLLDQELRAEYGIGPGGARESDDDAEYVVPVRWTVAVPQSEAYWVKGMFANQNSACKLRQEFTLDRLAEHFALDDLEEGHRAS